jgi:nitroreductase
MKYNLSEVTDIIRNRRSIMPEQFSPRKVHREQIEVMLNNAIWAPTHGLTQPWRFKVFMDEAREELSNVLSELYIAQTPAEKINPLKQQRLKARPLLASAVIAICLERDKSEKIAEIEEIEAVACAVQNLHLTATAYGLGGFWSTPKMIYSAEMHTFLGLKEKDLCLGLFYLGYPEGEWPKSHRKPLEYVVEWRTTRK